MKSLWIIITLGLILRIILSLSTSHSDMQVFAKAGKIVASGNILNLYDFTSSSAVLNYPPLIYLYHGLFRFLFGGIENPLVLKFPYLIFDALAAVTLYKLFNARREKILALGLWVFNPVSLYATYMMGQFDIIPTFFIILSVYLAVKNKLYLAALALGFGIAFKISPLFLIIPLLIFGKSIGEKMKLLFLALAPYLLTIIPYLSSHSFRITALFANQNSKSLYANLPVSGGESILLFPAFLLFFYLVIWLHKPGIDIAKLYLIPLLLFFIFTHYHPQWLIWITPLLILELVKSGFRNWLPNILIFLSWFASLFFFDPSLTVGIFAPVAPLLRDLPSIWILLNISFDYNVMRSLIQTVFVAASLYLIYRYLPVKRQD